MLTLGNDWKFKFTVPSHYIDDGIKPVFEVRTRLGRKIKCTFTHPLLTIDGWKPLSGLQTGNKIAVPRVLNVFGTETWRACEIKLLAYLLGDGSLTGTTPRFTVENAELRRDFMAAAEAFGGVEAVPAFSQNRAFSLCVRKIGGNRRGANPLTEWLRVLGIYGHGAHEKIIPADVFTLRREQLALFLNRLFATDGWACVLASGQAQLGFASVSEKLIRQVQHLLLRFGVIASLKTRQVKYKNERRPAFQLDITDALSIQTFIREIGIHGKTEALGKVSAALEGRRYQTNRDLIPRNIWREIEHLKGAESWASLARRAGVKGLSLIHI